MRDPGLRSNRAVELRVGVLVLLSAAMLIWGVFWISDKELGAGLQLYAIAADAQQITDGARVYLRGVDVGSVREVRLYEHHVVLGLDVRYSEPLPADTRGLIRPAGFLGNQMIVLLPGESATALASGDSISLSVGAEISTIAGELGDKADELLARAAALISDQTIADVQTTSAAVAAAMSQLRTLMEEQSSTIGELVVNLNAVSSQLRGATEATDLAATVARIDSITTRLESASAGLDSTSHSLASITRKMDDGEGTLGLLVNDEGLYVKISAAMENIQAATEEIALLTKDIRQRPDRYLKGLKFEAF
ncbi:MAG: MCE family protein [Gemmatimonadota bacterium]|jgi:phospholipid/cholesterol/gamma-HCH transport system substrate-binding protein|nr:MAG: MCE family protein [Gemmatimonadota bacterium]